VVPLFVTAPAYLGHFTVAVNSSPPSKYLFGDGGCEFSSAFHTPPINHRKNPSMLKLHAGVSKKVGLPGFSSASASCTIEAELDSSLLQDRDGFQTVVRRAYQSCEKAVEDQIARLLVQGNPAPNSPACVPDASEHPQTTNGPQTRSQSPSRASQPITQEVIEVRTSPAISGTTVTRIPAAQFTNRPSPRPATVSQVKAIRAICARRRIDLVSLLRERYGLGTADELGIRQASTLIDELKSDEPTTTPTNGNGSYAVNGGAR
jgi:hypothetical protein